MSVNHLMAQLIEDRLSKLDKERSTKDRELCEAARRVGDCKLALEIANFAHRLNDGEANLEVHLKAFNPKLEVKLLSISGSLAPHLVMVLLRYAKELAGVEDDPGGIDD